jgi:hypothetical protein
VSYRDETWMLRERLGELEEEHARASGRVAGLEVALAEAEERERDADRAFSALKLRRGAKRATARIFGWGSAVALTVGACAFAIWCGESLDDESEAFDLAVTVSERAGLDSGDRCSLSVVETAEIEGRPCEAELRCGSIAIYRGHGACERFFEADLLEYWDHDLDDGASLVLVASERVVVVRDRGALVTLGIR